MSSGRIAACRLGMVWAGASLVFRTPALRGRGVPEISRAGWEKKPQTANKTEDERCFKIAPSRFSQADVPALVSGPVQNHRRENTFLALAG